MSQFTWSIFLNIHICLNDQKQGAAWGGTVLRFAPLQVNLVPGSGSVAKVHMFQSHLNTSRAWPLSGDVSLKKGTTRDRLALLRDAPVPPLALSATPPTKPPARVRAVVCFFRNFSSGFIPAGMVGRWVGGGGQRYTGGWRGVKGW